MDHETENAQTPMVGRSLAPAIAALFLGLFALLLTTPAFPLAPRLLDAVAPGVNVGVFTAAAGFVAIACAVAQALLAGAGRGARVFGARWAVGGSALYLVMFLAGFALMPRFSSDALALAFGCLLGAGISAVFSAWGAAAATVLRGRVSFGGMLAALCLAMGAAVCANMALVGAPRAVAAAAVFVAAVAGAAVPAVVLVREAASSGTSGQDKATLGELIEMALGAGTVAPSADSAAEGSSDGESAEGAGARWRSLAAQAVLPVVVLALYASSQVISRSIEGSHAFEPWCVLAAVVLALLPLLVRDDSRRIAFSLRVLLPLFGVLVLGATALAPDALEPQVASFGAIMLSFAYGLTLFALLAYFAISRTPSAMGALGALMAGVLAAVMVLPHATLRSVSEAALPLLLVALTAALVLLVASPSLAAWGGSFALAQASRADVASSEGQEGALRRGVQEACDAVADEFALSPREREILHYLGRGYGPRYLATILPIKENTIRSHVRNIYAKTDVHTQPELLELIDAHAR